MYTRGEAVNSGRMDQPYGPGERMKKPLPDSILRVGPFRNQEPIAGLWRIWVYDREVYATRRFPIPGPPPVKISIHFSGQVHLTLGTALRRLLEKPLPVGSGEWLCPLQWRFLLPPNSLKPTEQRLKKGAVVGVSVPEGSNLVLRVLVASQPVATLSAPTEFGGTVIWRTSLAGGYPVVAIAGGVAMTRDIERTISELRSEANGPVTFRDEPNAGPPYVELTRVHAGPDGNILTVLPCGPDSVEIA
jgi:hypothetical protein